MAKPHLPGHRRTRPGGQAAAGRASAPREPLGADAAEAAEAAAEAEAAAWVEESWNLPPGEEPGWFRDNALEETEDTGFKASGGADESPSALEASSLTAVQTPPPAAGSTPDEAAGTPPVAGAIPGAAEGPQDEAEEAPDEAAGTPPVAGAALAEEAGATVAEEAGVAASGQPEAGGAGSAGDADGDGEGDAPGTEDADASPTPGTIYRTVPPLPEDATARPRRRSPLVSLLVGLLILVVVGAGGFAIGMLLPLLIPLPAGSISTVSPAPTVGSTAAPTAGSSGTPGAASGGASPSAGAPATPSPSVAPAPGATPLVYVVQRGDQLGRIAQSFGVTLQALQAANGITNPNLIVTGQRLVIPSPGASPGPSPIPSATGAP
jgi:LysM repeat protein